MLFDRIPSYASCLSRLRPSGGQCTCGASTFINKAFQLLSQYIYATPKLEHDVSGIAVQNITVTMMEIDGTSLFHISLVSLGR